MPNPVLFPEDFSNSISNAQVSGASAIDVAVKNLQTDSRLSALRQAESKRILGRQTSALQNSLQSTLVAKSTRMPLHNVGKVQTPPSMLGTVGYFVGGQDAQKSNSIERFTFSGEAISLTSLRLTEGRSYAASVGNSRAFYTAGGVGDNNPAYVTSKIDRTLFADESTYQISASLSNPTYFFVGVGNSSNGYYFGGVNQWVISYRKTEKLSFAQPETVSLLSTQLATGRSAGLGTAGTATHGFLFGGTSVNFGNWTGLTSIEKFAYSGESISTISTTLPRVQGHATVSGNNLAAYVCGGWLNINYPYVSSNPVVYQNNTSITRFLFSNETTSALGISLTGSRLSSSSFSSNRSLYVGGGFTTEQAFPLASRYIDKIDISSASSETIYRLGVELVSTRSEQTGISDYAAGFVS